MRQKNGMHIRIFLFLDFDGTLTPIDPSPLMTVLSPDTRKTLKKLSRAPGLRTAIVSGRALGDLRRRVGVKALLYAGNNGFEIRGCGIRYSVPVQRSTRRLLRKIFLQLGSAYSHVKGFHVEHKDSTVAFHYRMVKPSAVPALKRSFLRFIRPYVKSGTVKVFTGKEVFEISAPVAWHKGSAVRYILDRCGSRDVLPIYIGDDTNDRSAFLEVLKRGGITISVGKKRLSPAQFSLRNPGDVVTFLKAIDIILTYCVGRKGNHYDRNSAGIRSPFR